jgi:cytochrome c-type biogenesis protein CcsB
VNDVVLAIYSDRLFMAAVGVYVLAMALHAAEYAALRTARPSVVAGAPVAVGAASGTAGVAGIRDERPARPDLSDEGAVRTGAAADVAPADAAGRPVRSRADRLGGAAVNLVVLAVLLQLGSIVCRGLAADRWPLGNMYEFTSAVCLAAVVTWLVVLRRLPALRSVALFVLLPVVILLFLAGTVLYARAAPVVPALRSYWLVVHVTTITVSSGLLLVPGIASLLFLLRRSGRGGAFVDRLPSAATLDRLAYRTTIVAFPLYTFGVIAGAIWAEAAWGRFWGWDPKETVAFVAWVVYAAYLHARATAGWRSGRAAWINVAGLAVVLFNLFFINMVVAGLHSYAGL